MLKSSTLFLRNGVPEKIVIFIYSNGHKENNYSRIARNIGCTFSATSKNLRMMEELGIVEVTEADNKKNIKLTLKGQKIVEFLKEFEKF